MKRRQTAASAVAALMIVSSLFTGLKPAFALQGDANGKANAATKKPGKDTVYTCVHHPDMMSGSPGTCPKCLMALTKKSKTKTKRS